MPQAFAWIGANLFMSQVAVGLGQFLMTYATVLGTGAMLLGAAAFSNRQKKKAIAKYNASQVDRLANVPTTTGPRELVLGRVRKGGVIIFRDSAGSYKEHFYMVIALAAHEIDAVEQIYFNDRPITVDGGGVVTTSPYQVVTRRTVITAAYVDPATITNLVPGSYIYSDGSTTYDTLPATRYDVYDYANYAVVRTYLGTDTQTADTMLMSAFPGVWTSNHRLRGVAYIVVRFTYNESVFPSGIPTVTARIRGAKCYDPRTGLTAWTMNPALHIRHVLTHPYFGKRTSLTVEEDERFEVEASACDTSYTPVGGTAGPLYQSSIVFPFGASAVDCFDDLVQACCGYWSYAGGEFYLRVGTYRAPVMALTSDDLATSTRRLDGSMDTTPIIINTHKARADKLNVIVPKIWNAGQDYKEVVLTPVKNTLAIAEDGKELAQDLTFPAVPFAYLATVVSNFILKENRDPLMVTANFKFKAYPLELFDHITLTIARYGWSAKEFMILGKTAAADGSIQLNMKETAPALFDPAAAPNVEGYADNSNLLEPWTIDNVGALTVESDEDYLHLTADGQVMSGVKVSWPEIVDNRVQESGYVDLRWRSLGANTAWTQLSVDGNQTFVVFYGAREQVFVEVQARTRTGLVTSEWGLPYFHMVVGKTAPPPNVASGQVVVGNGAARLTWTAVNILDLAGYEVRLTNSGFGTDGAVFRGNALSTPISPTNSTWYIRAYDTSGNYSAASLTVNYTFLAVPNVTAVSHFFADTALTTATVTLRWTEAANPQFPVDRYKVVYGSVTEYVKGSTITLPASWVGDRAFTITTIDQNGLESSGVVYIVTKLRPAAVENFRAQVVDNNVLFYWTLPVKTSLPISHVLLKRGLDWATATTIGTKSGEFTTVSELAGGDYVYWIATVDTDGYVTDTPISLSVRVSQPPDFIFNADYTSDLQTGTYSNALFDQNVILLPINITESWTNHFVNNSFNHPQAQIDAGYPYYIQPGTSTGYYEETFDYGTSLGSSSITVSANVQQLTGTYTVTPTISVSTDNVNWTSYPGQFSAFAQNFRYVRVRIAVTQVTAGALAQLVSLDVRLDTKLKTDAGVVNCLSTDTNGTIVNFNTDFVDVVSISPSVAATQARYCVYEFRDALQSGTYTLTSNVITISETAHGLIAGQKVRLMPSSGTLPLGTYTVASVINANSYTVNHTAANTSGNLNTYPNSARFRVFDASGTRQTENVSWTVRGS